jgi:hypothetical protein
VTEKSIRDALSALPKDLNDTYRQLFNSIEETFSSRAVLALKWIVLTVRSLFLEELVEACAFQAAATPQLESESSRLQVHHLLELLKDLIVIEPPLDSESAIGGIKKGVYTVSLAHISLTEYLIDPTPDITSQHLFRFSPDEGHRILASSCLSYVFHFNTVHAGGTTYDLLEYAWYHWEKHIVTATMKAHERGRIRTRALNLMDQLMGLVNGIREVPERDAIFQVLQWLSPAQFDRLRLSLETPYFHPLFQENLGTTSSSTIYSPITQSCGIRILHLVPSLSRQGPVSCHLEHVTLRDKPQFNAISYRWGDLRVPEYVLLNGIRTAVSQNLHHVLETLSAQEQGHTPTLWVDALCINQSDYQERSHQVPLLAKVYETAKEVVICAGVATDADEGIIKALKNRATTIFEHGDLKQPSSTDEISEDFDHNRAVELLSDEYWTRMWTVQEIVLARHGTVLLRPHSIPLSVLEGYMREYITGAVLGHRFITDPRLSYLRASVFVRLKYQAGHAVELVELLYWFCDHKCSDPRNKVYGLLVLLPSITQPILVDYTRSYVDVFMDVAMVTLFEGKNLNVLSHVSSQHAGWRNGFSGPSWLPTYQSMRQPFPSCSRESWKFRAGGETDPVIERRDEDGVGVLLGVQGIIVDYVSLPHVTEGTQDEPEYGRQWFLTNSNGAGLGPGHLQHGDVVVIFGGGPVPYILRKEKQFAETWEFIGEW